MKKSNRKFALNVVAGLFVAGLARVQAALERTGSCVVRLRSSGHRFQNAFRRIRVCCSLFALKEHNIPAQGKLRSTAKPRSAALGIDHPWNRTP